jgi:HPt (histidine-containing phosphotransfer) domain-containing protein
MLQSDGRSAMQQIRDALAAGDAPAVGRTAHALKGIVSNFCAPRTQELALSVEQMGKSGDLSAVPEAAADLAVHLEALLGELAAFVKEKT